MFGYLATVHFPGNIFFEGHSWGHNGSNDIGLEFLSCEVAEKKSVHTHSHTYGTYSA